MYTVKFQSHCSKSINTCSFYIEHIIVLFKSLKFQKTLKRRYLDKVLFKKNNIVGD